MVVARASGTDLASILKRNTFLTLGVRSERETGDVVTYPEHPIRHLFVGPTNFAGSVKMVENRACPNLDAMSVPEALVYSILHHFAQGIRIKHP